VRRFYDAEGAGGSRIRATEDAMKKSAKRVPVKGVEVEVVAGGGDGVVIPIPGDPAPGDAHQPG